MKNTARGDAQKYGLLAIIVGIAVLVMFRLLASAFPATT